MYLSLEQRHEVRAQLRHVLAHAAAGREGGRHREAARRVRAHLRGDLARRARVRQHRHAAGHGLVQHLARGDGRGYIYLFLTYSVGKVI